MAGSFAVSSRRRATPSRRVRARVVLRQYGSIAIVPKLTFSLDDETVETLRNAAARSGKPQSLIVREAVAQYAAREDRLSDADRERLLGVLRRIRKRPATRRAAAVDRELQDVRRSRRRGWTRPSR
jgi:predicted DNA-binding protein